MDGREIIKQVLIGLGGMIVVGYTGFTVSDYVRGPRLAILSPQDGAATTTALITITGRTTHTNVVLINDATTTPNLEGYFGEDILLAPGYNIMNVTAKDQYGRVIKKDITMTLVVPKPPETVATSTPSSPIPESPPPDLAKTATSTIINEVQ